MYLCFKFYRVTKKNHTFKLDVLSKGHMNELIQCNISMIRKSSQKNMSRYFNYFKLKILVYYYKLYNPKQKMFSF